VKELRARSRAKGDANGDYNAYHIRRGDFQYTVTRYDAPRIIKNSAKEMTMGGVVYIASDETDQSFFKPLREAFDVVMLDDFKHLLEGVNSNYYGMIDSLIASRSKVFFGCWFSTFTGYINRLRGFHNNKRKGMGYDMGYHSSYYYALDDRKYHLQEYYPVKKSFYAREFPTSWRLIDEGIVELAEADKKKNV
jgi:GDP-fucose protein O-fucosyltransferase